MGVARKRKRTGGINYNFIHPHCGPFNTVKKVKSDDGVDEICRQHDIGYGELGPKAYFMYNEHDDKFVRAMDRQEGILPKIYGGVFKVKKALMPHMTSSHKQMRVGKKSTGRFRRKTGKKVIKRKRYSRKTYKKKDKKGNRRFKKTRFGHKKFKKGKRFNSKVNEKGSVLKVEDGGVAKTFVNDTLYIGHGCSMYEAYLSMWRAIVKEVMIQRKSDFSDWKENIYNLNDNDDDQSTLSFEIDYVKNEANSIGATYMLYYLNAPCTYQDAALRLGEAFLNEIKAVKSEVCIDRILVSDNYTGDTTQPVASIEMSQFFANFSYVSNLKIQNRTLGDPHGDPDGNVDTVIDVARNPIVGKLYRHRKSWRNHMVPNKNSFNTGAPSCILTPNRSGVFASSSTLYPSVLKKPPPGWVFDSSQHSFGVSPGSWYHVKHRFKCSMSMKEFSRKFNPLFAAWIETDEFPLSYAGNLGWCDMIAIERYLDAVRANTNFVQVGYQIEQTYMCYGTKKPMKTTPLVQSTASPGNFTFTA